MKFSVPYNQEFIEDIKAIGKAMYTRENKAWLIVVDYTNSHKIDSLIKKFSLKQFFINYDNLYQPTNETLLERIKNGLEHKLTNFQSPKQPRHYQIDGIIKNLYFKKCINGSDMGTGKTLTSIFTVELYNLYPCLIIVPNSVKFNWQRQFKEVSPNKTIQVLDSKSVIEEADIYIINYDILSAKKSGKRKINLRFPELENIKWKSIICDESHMLKNNTSIRTKAVSKLAKLSEYVFLLTGTPVMNRPIELVSQLKLIDKFENLFGSEFEFMYRYCDAKKTEYRTDSSGASNVPQLSKILSQTCYYRVGKREVLTELPPIQETMFEVELSNLKEYTRAKNDLIVYLQENFGNIAAAKAEMAQSLVLINTLRQLALKGKISAIKDWIDMYLESTDRKLVVFGTYNDPLDELSRHYQSDLIYGGYNAEERQTILDWFRFTDQRILFLNMFAGGTGIDGLQDVCSDMLILDLPWRSTDLDQVVSRIERDGAKYNINVNYTLAKNTIDMEMWDYIESKRKVVDQINKGETADERNIVIQILKNYL